MYLDCINSIKNYNTSLSLLDYEIVLAEVSYLRDFNKSAYFTKKNEKIVNLQVITRRGKEFSFNF